MQLNAAAKQQPRCWLAITSWRIRLANVYSHRGFAEQAEVEIHRALTELEQYDRECACVPVETAAFVMRRLARAYRSRAKYHQAVSTYLRLAESLCSDGPIGANLHSNLAQLYRRTSSWNQAIAHARVVLSINQRLWGDVHPDTAQAHYDLARILSKNEHLQLAQLHFESCVNSTIS